MKDYLLLENAVGTIQAGPAQQARLDELTDRLTSNEFYVATTDAIPSACIDGRTGSLRSVPNAAGGSESLLVADDLTYKRLVDGDDSSTAGEYGNLLTLLAAKDLPFGGHTDGHASGAASGCGANDKLGLIYAFIAGHGDTLRKTAVALGVTVGDAAHAMITKNAVARDDFSDGAELLARLREREGAVDSLRGTHNEVAAVINTVPGTTLDRDALEAVFGNEYEAFNVDVWSFEAVAKVLSEDDVEIEALVAAMVYYNLATACVLCGPDMRVIVRTA